MSNHNDLDKLDSYKVIQLNKGLVIRIVYAKSDLENLIKLRGYKDEDHAFNDIIEMRARYMPDFVIQLKECHMFALFVVDGIVPITVSEMLVPLSFSSRRPPQPYSGANLGADGMVGVTSHPVVPNSSHRSTRPPHPSVDTSIWPKAPGAYEVVKEQQLSDTAKLLTIPSPPVPGSKLSPYIQSSRPYGERYT